MSVVPDDKKLRTDARTLKTFIKGIFDCVLITILTCSLFVTVITAVEHDSLLDEFVPIIVGAVLFPLTLYIFQVIQTVVKTIKDSLVLRRRQVDGLAHIDTSVGRFNEEQPGRYRHTPKSIAILALKKAKVWYSYAKLSLTFMMHNSYITLLFWDSLKLTLWLMTLTYWRRSKHTDEWDFSRTPQSIYRLHYGSLSLTNTELCLFILGTTDIKDVLCSSLFWINICILPPMTLFMKLLFFHHLTFFKIYWMLGFLIWLKYFLLLDRLINIFNVGIERRAHRVWKIALGIFLMASAFASSMYVLQGIHPLEANDNAYSYSLAQYAEFFYFAFITFATVGYGDVVPMTTETKMVSVCFVSCMIVWIPYEMNNFIQGVGSTNRISGHISSWGPMEAFIILIGDVDPIQLSLFISKVYYAGLKLKIIVLSNLSIETYETQINQAKLLRLSLCIIRDDIGLDGNVDILHTIKAKDAAATFVLSTFKNPDARKTDMNTVARLISLKKFGLSSDNVVAQFCSSIGPQISLQAFGRSMNLYRFKTALIAKNITCPGIITLVINLSLTHNAVMPQDRKQQQECRGSSDLYTHYLIGIGKRLRICEIPERLVGVSFETLCLNLYNRHGYITIGIMQVDSAYHTYLLNPASHDYVINQGDRAILIADSTSTASVETDFVAAGRHSSSVALRNTMITMFLEKWGNVVHVEKDDNDDLDGSIGMPPPPLYTSAESKFISERENLMDHVPDVNSIIVTSITFASRYVYDNPTRPIIAIIGYSEFVIHLLLYFEELNEFNVVLFGREISSKANIAILQRFRSFLALIDGDPLKKGDVNRAELDRACYLYVLRSPELEEPGISDVDLDLQTIVTYRHLKNIIQSNLSEKNAVNNPYSNIFSLVELHNASNVSYLDDSKWSAWNVLDKRLDPSLAYIHSLEYSMGQFISDEMLYSLCMNTMLVHEDFSIYRILMDLACVRDSSHNFVSLFASGGIATQKGLMLIPTTDITLDSNKRTFGHLFNYLFEKRNMVMIGIYRV
ncbi:ion channel protein [Babesia ovata]|uniref:Ion channel protein n=1 Tax=Babesia ovata TaxID=189622 RepID=A0A2H6KFN6_9APIC|nr:ion channel protein [Babesia ovata]GBE61794.1 ion channel protein [Babesia ovata]